MEIVYRYTYVHSNWSRTIKIKGIYSFMPLSETWLSLGSFSDIHVCCTTSCRKTSVPTFVKIHIIYFLIVSYRRAGRRTDIWTDGSYFFIDHSFLLLTEGLIMQFLLSGHVLLNVFTIGIHSCSL
jgi:hypothetical protein